MITITNLRQYKETVNYLAFRNLRLKSIQTEDENLEGLLIEKQHGYIIFRFVGLTDPQIIRFQVSRENTRSNGGLFYLCLLTLGFLDDSEVEINDVLGEGDNITFIVRIKRSPRLHLRYLSIFLTSSRVTFE